MPEVAVLAEVRVGREDIANLMEYRAKNLKALGKSPGFESFSIWEAQNRRGTYLILIGYADEAAAEEGLKASLDAGPLVEAMKNVKKPPLVRRGEISFQRGVSIDALPEHAYMSMSVRVATPGMGEDLVRELDRIFAELAVIDGYLGAFVCRSEALPEEAVGVAFWNSREAFEASLPPDSVYKVELFRRTI